MEALQTILPRKDGRQNLGMGDVVSLVERAQNNLMKKRKNYTKIIKE